MLDHVEVNRHAHSSRAAVQIGLFRPKESMERRIGGREIEGGLDDNHRESGAADRKRRKYRVGSVLDLTLDHIPCSERIVCDCCVYTHDWRW